MELLTSKRNNIGYTAIACLQKVACLQGSSSVTNAVQDAAVLPLAIWGKIFELLRPVPPQSRLNVEQILSFQGHIGRLSLVCKTFHDVSRAHPELFRNCSVSNSMLIKAEHSTLAWLQAQGPMAFCFHGPADPARTCSCLMALSHANSVLKHIEISVSPTTQLATMMNTLGNFKALTTCRLKCSFSTDLLPVDLTPLQSLQKLTRLGLEAGTFVHMNLVQHLTYLAVENAKAYGVECSFCTSLVCITVQDSYLPDMSTDGLRACTALQSMHVWGRSHVGASHLEDRFDTHVPSGAHLHMPQHLSRLCSLRELTLVTTTHGWQPCYKQICTLTNLQRLFLLVAGHFKIDHAFEALVNLRDLGLGASPDLTDGQQGCLELSLEWKALQVFTSFYILSPFTCNANILGLLELQHFRCLGIKDAPVAGSLSAELLGILTQRLLAAGKAVEFNVAS
ncbi:hypothetical protein ABBQ38_014503 [Trebouxia sp. C0009 RCD-2024]